jgi:uncharacterized protein YjiS (DUF1127 family)
MEIQMSNRLYARERLDTVTGVEGSAPFDRLTVLKQAESMRAEAFGLMISTLWRAIRDAGQKIFGSRDSNRTDADLAELDDHLLADIGINRYQVPGFVAREIAAAQEIANRNRSERETAHAA